MRARIGYAAWVAGVVQFFVAHGTVQAAWAQPYSWAANNVSDLGNAHCAMQPDPTPRYICSPEHGLMNGSFIALGTLLLLGVALTGRALWRQGRAAAAARVLLAGAGVGFVLVGLAPADVNENLHILGALLIMGTGNIGLLLAAFGLADNAPALLRRAAGLLSVLAVAAFGLFLSHHYLGLGMGGMERVALLPLLAWSFTVGLRGLLRPAVRA
ncbi:hypothetical protein BLA24_30815 [Streptomyces cinnamoneus]|uniref:Uncharacterized protein n=2 Tax=Streptomyces cinnamoneus TaxID=53446 RepID=A0A2G1X9J7_STRCJ|nr:DUF998 domain-containing protein [Streptomyces cinnamoneus]PHQ47898.1 hypothetical protein BLA24_30815 [Streptomyces cinnamoneus]PPT15523.1 DUF998 domain-containing protein [Streptomyces cinnamoneus]